MKPAILTILTAISLVVATPVTMAIATGDDDSHLVAMALNADGRLHEIHNGAWVAVGEPCPTPGPYELSLMSFGDDSFIFVVDGEGRLYQTDTVDWIELAAPPEGAVSPCLARIAHLSAEGINAMILDTAGDLFISGGDKGWRKVGEGFPAGPPRDMIVIFEKAARNYHPFVLGDDSLLYALVDDGWEPSSDLDTGEAGLTGLDYHLDQESLRLYLVFVDETGTIYDNFTEAGLRQADIPPCPGVGPWRLKLVGLPEARFDLLSIDSAGSLYIVHNDGWKELTGPFPE